MTKRLKAMGQPNYRNGFKLETHELSLGIPKRWKKPQTVFVNSMSDLFHKDVPIEFIQRVFRVMVETPIHQYQALTKRAGRLEKISGQLPWPDNVWMGVSVENEDYLHRIDSLRKTDAKVKFLSLEPLLGPLSGLNLEGIDWVIVGGESGPGSRPIQKEWVIEIRDICLESGVPFFFKQWGGVNKKKAGKLLEDREWTQMPDRKCFVPA